ncbi:hypothetical protein DSM106972_014770 [Dulcicalothrix desertica PCC 7102]|uniref:Uncharacterized protein n=1 Tax=Dulcicalothrix desertica PCC 7102 TaxID=232991 RepID=A0A3S1CTD3_9CYAN|nr:hypothetical protein [Dulcicalothrix desertica]RUT08309.1 hypothetical protein DSM106972_014770 [Dulcicalothrix desertica PCC 7102]TWH40175.1 hypothetical protein CAL7102_09477 [Dulcicalothrix desertica PCC 7102]
MLLDKAQEFIELCEIKKTKQKFASNLDTFKSKQRQINEAVNTIRPVIEALKAFRKREILNDVAPTTSDLLATITEAEKKFNENSDSIIDFKVNTLKSRIETLKKILEQQLIQSWKTYLNDNMPSTNNEVLNVMAKFDEFKQTVNEIRNLDKEIKEVNYPKNDAEFTKHEGKIKQLKLCWDVESDKFPETILQFLKDAANPNKGASLNLLTTEVKDWIEKYNISDSLKIRLT